MRRPVRDRDGRRGAVSLRRAARRQVYRRRAVITAITHQDHRVRRSRSRGASPVHDAGCAPHAPTDGVTPWSSTRTPVSIPARSRTCAASAGGGGGGGGLGGIPIPRRRRRRHRRPDRAWRCVVVGGLVGGNSLLGGGGDHNADTGNSSQDCATSNPDRLNDVDCRNVLYINSIQNYWTDRAAAGVRQAVPAGRRPVFFSQSVNTGCGAGRQRRRAVLLPRGRPGVHRPDVLRRAGHRVRRQGRVRPAVRAGPRVRPPHPGPARHRGRRCSARCSATRATRTRSR